MTNDGAFRVIAIGSTELSQAAAATHELSWASAGLMAELLTASILVRQTMSPSQRLQVFLRSADSAAVMADSYPDGLTRGLWSQEDPDAAVLFGPDTQLQVIRVLHNQELHQGFVATRLGSNVSEAVTDYMMSSEQISTRVHIGVRLDAEGAVESAGGYIVQLLPEATEEGTRELEAHLDSLDPIESMLEKLGDDPMAILERILAPYEYTVLDTRTPFHGCLCSESRILGALSTIGEADLRELVAEGGFLPMRCDYCNTTYQIGTEQIRALLVEA